jgi:parallel beta-helix repeat protein
VNGIQTRWVDGFEFVRNESADNLNNGIYPTLSANGLVRNNVSYGSLDTAMWVAGSENVRVMGNELYDSVIGFEITVSNNVLVTHNDIYDNTVGVGLFHPNGAGNPPLDVMANWVIEHNDIYENNEPNKADPDTLQGKLLPGAGVLLVGVSDHVVAKNNIENNNYVGVGVLGWCTSGQDCSDLRGPPEAENNLISQNYLSGNGGEPPAEAPFPPADLLYIQYEVPAEESGNCFENNKPENELNTYAAYPPVFPPGDPPGQPLPTAGC